MKAICGSRIYIPTDLQNETLKWLGEKGRQQEFLFPGKSGRQITPRAIAARLKQFARMYNIEEKVLHPHSFRHFFAKNFLEKYGDITFLADLLGHESINTTRIYLRKSTEEQRKIINDVVKW